MAEERAGLLARADDFLKSRPGTIEVALFLLALAPRLYVATAWAHEPVWDGHYYHFGAERIAAGQGYSDESFGPSGAVWHPWCHYPVGYSGFLALFYAVFGPRPAVAVVVQALVLAVTASAVHRLALSFLGHRRALVAGLVCALHPGMILYAGLVMTEPLGGLGLVLAPLTYLKLQRRPRWAAVAAGAVLGLTTLVRPQTLLAAPALALLATGGTWKRRVGVALIATTACIAVVLPWSIRNCARMDGCAFVSTNAGWNLAIGSTPRATGRFTALHAEDGCTVVTGQVQQDRCWAGRATTWIAEDPVRWLGLAPAKLGYTFDHQSFAVGYLEQADPAAWPEARRTLYRGILSVSQYVLLLFAALGAVVMPRGRVRDVGLGLGFGLAFVLFADGIMSDPKHVWPLAVAIPILAVVPPVARASRGVVAYVAWVLFTFVLVHVVFFGEDRYQIVVTPLLIVLSAAAFRWSPEFPAARGGTLGS